MIGNDYSLFRLGKRGMFIGAISASALVFGVSGCTSNSGSSDDGVEAHNVHVDSINNVRLPFASENYNLYRYCDGNNTVYNVVAQNDSGDSMSIVPNDPRCHNSKFSSAPKKSMTTYNMPVSDNFHTKRACDDNVMVYIMDSDKGIAIRTVANDPRCKS